VQQVTGLLHGGLAWLARRAGHRQRDRYPQHVRQAALVQEGTQARILAVVGVGGHPAKGQAALDGAAQHRDAQLGLGGEGDLLRDPGVPAALHVPGPDGGQVQAPVEEGVPGPGRVGEHHHHLAVAHVPSDPAMLMGHPDRPRPLLDHLGVVQYQRGLRITQLTSDVVLDLGQQRTRVPGRFTEELLDPVRGGVPGPLGHRPAVLATQVRQQALDQVREHLPRLRTREQVPQPFSERGQFLRPPLHVLRRHIDQHDQTTTSPINSHKI
jgi:hypothetical protein